LKARLTLAIDSKYLWLRTKVEQQANLESRCREISVNLADSRPVQLEPGFGFDDDYVVNDEVQSLKAEGLSLV